MQKPAIIRKSYIVRLLIGFLLAATVLILCNWLITDALKFQLESLDSCVRAVAQDNSTPALANLLIIVTKLGSTVYLTGIGIVAGVIFIVLGWKRDLAIFLISMAGQIVLHHSGKAFFQRSRPEPFFDYPVGESYSFPSGHALASFCFYLVLGWLISRHLKSSIGRAVILIFLTLLVLAIGLSRVYIGIHYLTDVIGGYLAALVWTAVVLSMDIECGRNARKETS